MTPPYSLLGSCVTRDAADLGSSPLPRPVAYFSRTKLQSLVSTPTEIPDDIGLASPFQTRVVVEDHRKTAIPVLAATDHAVVIDLIDERLELLDSGTGLVTESLYLRQSPLRTERPYTKVPEDTNLDFDGPFAQAAQELAKVLSRVPRVVIHEALWATTARDGSTLSDAPASERRNAWLRVAYQRLRDAFPDAVRVVPDPHVVLADPGHRWGLAPFHYVPDYYDDVAEKIRRALAA